MSLDIGTPPMLSKHLLGIEGTTREQLESILELTDRFADGQIEVDARTGAVVRFGARYGIETPINERAVALLSRCHLREGNLLDELCE